MMPAIVQFQSTPPTGGDFRSIKGAEEFQSTPPHRGRPYEPYLLIQQHEIG